MNLEDKLKTICDNVDGAVGSFFCGWDGLLIDKHEVRPVEIDLIAANLSSVIKYLNDSGAGRVEDIILTFTSTVVAIKITDDGFLGLVLSLDGNLGRAKLELNKSGGDFLNG